MSTVPRQVVVAGSCVSRDTFTAMDPHRYRLQAYVARQSLLSAFGGVVEVAELPARLSPFQARMVRGDLAGDLPRRLRRAAATTDLVLWDLCDERLGVYELPDGGRATRTPEVVGTALEAHLAREGRLLALGDPEHLGLWREAADAFLALLTGLGLRDRTVLLAPPWAQTARGAAQVPASFGVRPEEANARYVPYVEHVRQRGVPAVTVPVQAAVAVADHRWGLAPFHYAPETYDALIAGVEALPLPAPRGPQANGTSTEVVADGRPGEDAVSDSA